MSEEPRKPCPVATVDNEPVFCEDCYLSNYQKIQMKAMDKNVYHDGEIVVKKGQIFCPRCGCEWYANDARLKKLAAEDAALRERMAEHRQEMIYKWLM